MTVQHYYATLYDELRAIMIDALPILGQNGVWVTQQVSRVPFENLALPFGGIHVDNFPRTHEWGAGVLLYNPTVHLYYAKKQTWDSLEVAYDLEILRDTLEFAEISNGQINWVEEVNWGDDLAPNVFFNDKNITARAGRISLNLLIGTQGNVALP